MNIVYSFIGNLPEYAIHTVYQTRLFYDGPIYFILSDVHSAYAQILQKEYNVHIIAYEEVRHNAFDSCMTKYSNKLMYLHGLTGREQLFLRSFERFYLLSNLMKKYNLSNCFFIEVDNTLYCDMRKWQDVFDKKDMWFMMETKDRGASGICYCKTTETLDAFLDFCTQYIENDTSGFQSEMIALSKFYNFTNKKEDIGFFPVHWHVDHLDKNTSIYFHEFEELFDAAGLGIYLGGMDPYHTGGRIIKGLKNKWSDLDYTPYTYEWIKDDQDRLIPYIVHENKKLKINNLHIHSKYLLPLLSKPFIN